MRTLSRALKLVIVLSLLLMAALGSFAFWLYLPRQHPTVDVFIKEGTSLKQIANALAEKKVIALPKVFIGGVHLMGLDSRLRAGDYTFESGLNIAKVLKKLLKGDFRTYRITIVEGWTEKQIADYLLRLPFLETANLNDEFLAKCKDKDFIESLGLSEEALEGFLFPNTYDIYRNESAEKIIKRLVTEFKKNYTPDMEARAGELNMSQNDVVTLASIIEKEAGAADERPLVAAVFLNRLKKGMLLQSDPTIIYGLTNYNGNIKERDIRNPHKYNTYVHPGLPPGPICNPGLASIKAVLWPADADYLYFVSKNDGTHYFSKTLEEHNRAVREYQSRKGN